MARRYIDADALIEKLKEQKDCRGALFIPFLTLVEIQATADVVPKSEVDKWFRECEELQGRLIELKKEIAREIFEEIEKRLAMYSHIHRYAEEANKVTEEYADGSPVEMTSVWDACRLEHNGYDDYETMCKLQDNIGNIEKSRLLKEFEGDIAELKKKYTEDKPRKEYEGK